MPPAAPLSSRRLLEEAAAAGAGDWGDLGFVGALDRLLEAGDAMTGLGRDVLRRVVLRRLLNRAHIAAHVRDHPEVVDRRLAVLAVVTGLPRTGTTVLHNLLAQDSAHRPLLLWEALHPVPPDPAGRFSRAQLMAQAERWLERMYQLVPDFRAIHPVRAEGPEECDALLQNAFAGQHLDDMFDSPRYSSWLYDSDLTDEYGYYALQLRALSAADEPWVLKSPSHLAHLDELHAVVPDAVVVWCHRQPVEAVASWASLIRAVRQPYYDSVPPEVVGRQALARSGTAMDRALQARQRLGRRVVLDVPYRLIVQDPLEAVRLVYERAGRMLSYPAETAMRRWLADNPQHRHGAHRYDPESFGLTAGEVRERFAGYLGSFGEMVG